MRFNLTDLNPGTVCPLDPQDPDAGSITLRTLNSETLADIERKTRTRRVEYRRGQRHEVVDVNEALHSELLWDYAIVGWDGIEDENGVPIPCTRENKVTLMNGSPVFARIVGDLLDQLTEARIQRAESAEKN